MEPLLERESELDTLSAVERRLAEGEGAVVLVRGEAGIGKTSLLRAWRERAALNFHTGHCEPLSVPEPLGPVRELAASAGAAGMPELETEDRRGLALALRATLTAAGPAVAVIEDAHWVDPATVDVARLLARRAAEAPLALLVTLRDDQLASNPPLAMLIGDLASNPALVTIAPAPLTGAAVDVLAEGLVDGGEVQRLTAGNPFLVVEMIAAGGEMPRSVRDATLARVARLRPEARGLVDLAAVTGRRVSLELMSQLDSGAEEAIEEARALGVLTDDGTGLGFRHELTRQAIEQSLSTPRRVALHARVVESLLAAAAPDHARIAHHAEAAALSETAAHHAVLAAGEAEKVGALLEAGQQLDRALRRGEHDAGERMDLLLRFARAMNFAGSDLEVAREAAAEAVRLADGQDEPMARGRARTVLSATLWSLDRLAESRQAAAEAVELLRGAGDSHELARAYAALGRIESIAFSPTVAIALAPAALAAASAAGLQEAQVDISISLGLAQGHLGDKSAKETLERARQAALADSPAIQVIRAHVNAMAVASDMRDGAWADEALAEGLRRAALYETTIPRRYMLSVHARSLLDRGRFADTLARIEETRGEYYNGQIVADIVEALAHARCNGGAGPLAKLAQTLERLRDVPFGWRHLFARAALAEAAWISGDLDAARRNAAAGLGEELSFQLARPASDALLWGLRSGLAPPQDVEVAELPQPVGLELAGDWREAIAAWHCLEAPYEAAMAALPGDDRAAREAVTELRRLGADAAASAFARARRSQGGASLRGPRRSTLANKAGLTRREQEVLALLATGATNARIAVALTLSERTVAHHVSAILAKLDAGTRTGAVSAARAMGLLPAQDGPSAPQT